jgi:hypothetical protein
MSILDFEKLEEESIGAAWARFLHLLVSTPGPSLPIHVSLYIFCVGLDMDDALDINAIVGGSFVGKTPMEGREILDSLIENSSVPTDHNEPHLESVLVHESLSTTSELSFSKFLDYSIELSPEPRTLKKKEIQPSGFTFKFEDDHSRNLLDTSNSLDAQSGEDPYSVHADHSRNLLTELSHPVLEKQTKYIPICMPGSSFMHIVDISE